MTKIEFNAIETFMLSHMTDAAHDPQHIYRVLNAAVDIARHEAANGTQVEMDVVMAAALLHDIGRERQFADPTLCHAQVGGGMAQDFLAARGWLPERARQVRACINTHRFRKSNPPISIEAKIIFDADKLDAVGAVGIARTLIYKGQVNDKLYALNDAGEVVTDCPGAEYNSFFQEYNYKLKKLYDNFYTTRGQELAAGRKKTAEDFYNGLVAEITESHQGAALCLD